MTKLALPELPTEYTNLRACCVYAGVDELKTPRQHLGEPIYLEIINRAEESRKRLGRIPYLWSSTAIAFALFGIGMNAGWSGLLIWCLGMGGLTSFGWGLNLVRKPYEPTTQQLIGLAESADQIEFLMEIQDLRRRLGRERKTSGVWAVEIMPVARGGQANIRAVPASLFSSDHGLLLLLKEEGFEAVRTWAATDRKNFDRVFGSGVSHYYHNLADSLANREPAALCAPNCMATRSSTGP